MKLLNLYAVVGIGVVAAVAACSSSSPGGSTGNKGDGGTSSGGSSSSGGTGSSGSSSSGGEGGTLPLPTITITSPTPGQSGVQVTKATSTAGGSGITVGDDVVAVSFQTTNFTLMAPNGCGRVDANCGHIHVFVDYDVDAGTSPCGDNGAPYNAQWWTTAPAEADLTSCANSDPINGTHTVRLELHSDQHAPIDDENGNVIEATVSFTATGG